jgi:GT2 family glycosyltransferase
MSLDKVLVLLVDYNSSELVPGVLESIQEDKINVSILIVDNGSKVESYKQLKKITDPRVCLIRIEKNLGVGGGNNYGLEYAKINFPDIDYVFLLNTDAYCCRNILYELVQILKNNPDAASITPKIDMPDGTPWYGGSMIDYNTGVVSQFIPISPDNKKTYFEVDVFNGCAVLFDFQKLQNTGFLNDKLFMYYEEADLSLRLHKLGYKNLYCPHYTVIHAVSYTSRKVSFQKTYYMTRNKFVVFNKTMSLRSKLYFLAHELAFHLKYKKFKNAKYLLKGYFDFKRGRLGKLETRS